jgi:hypothetical protein
MGRLLKILIVILAYSTIKLFAGLDLFSSVIYGHYRFLAETYIHDKLRCLPLITKILI